MMWKVGFSDGSGAEPNCAWITDENDKAVVWGGESFGGHYGVRNPEHARLIAAAPAMLAALRDVQDFLRQSGYDTRLVREVIAACEVA